MPTYTQTVTASKSDSYTRLPGGAGADFTSIELTGDRRTQSDASHIVLHYTDVNIAATDTIDSAVLEVMPNASFADSIDMVIYGHLAVNPSPPDAFGDIATIAAVKTTANVVWQVTDAGHGVYVSSPDISAIIEEIIAQDGWTSGNDIVIILAGVADAGSSLITRFRSADYDIANTTSTAPKLTIAHTEPAAGSSIPAITHDPITIGI